ncbi:uncharacterized protein BJ212DRAFT_1295229 [Suillus subaureus]|uniref:Uncharacterized protein n=1 Tax=Suillus subaureus TaxID=48587 RepID=A0A9P7EMB7_9AGAM|nr:uncharacterized protein BJ212DRAFT_1295229 [Suillus subaureus]KAG1825902.1 hypothetical protein BJ212DRAFT_1295229 [Suillus subaureus]
MALKHKQQASSSCKTSSGFNLHPSTLESKQMETSRKSSLTLAVNSTLQELLRGSAGSSTAYRKANSKANQGLKSASQSHSRSKAQMVPKSKSARPLDFQFIAGEIIFIPCGTKQPKKTSHSYIPLLTPVLCNPQMPTLVEVQTLEVMRLVITDHIDDYKEHQDEIFQYLPQYYLCVKEKQRIIIPPGIQFPDGSLVARNARTNKRGGFRENVVILATRQSIPTSVLQGWVKSKGKDKMPSLPSRSASHCYSAPLFFPSSLWTPIWLYF